MSTEPFNPQTIEKKWRNYWSRMETHKTLENTSNPKFYCLDMFPYPSGSGLHVGHWRGYVLSDVWCRYKKLQGYNILHPMGWDAFGLPAENDAIKKGIYPAESTSNNIANFKRQLKEIGAMYDWTREINTSSPDYYKWTQWIFIKMYEKGLAYRKKMPINWCPSCQTGLANEEVVNGECERCGTTITKKPLEQWMLKITEYADRLLEDLEKLEWPDKTKKMQKNWIGKSEGVEVKFSVTGLNEFITVFTTRPDTLFGVTYMVLAPEHPMVDKITTTENQNKVEAYIKESLSKSNVERMIQDKQKTGVFTGGYCQNPVNGEEIPIWISDYVLIDYGTGAIMAVPAHDERDFEFARTFNLHIKRVIAKNEEEKDVELKQAYTDSGILINSAAFSGLNVDAGKKAITSFLKEKGLADFTVNYKLRDWVFSRQRYWGEPIPIIYCEKCGEIPVPEEDLPVTLPDVELYQPSGTGESPLATIDEWVNTSCPQCGSPVKRETNTMPQWAGSSWYFLRYPDSHNNNEPWSEDKVNYWLPVDLYVGGVEHAILHLLYARFFTKFLYDLGKIEFDEPFKQLFNQGMICKDGIKMSKSKGNIVSPDEIVKDYGTDCLRIYELFIGPPELDSEWNNSGVEGVYRFLNKMWDIALKSIENNLDPNSVITKETHKLIQNVQERIEGFKLNTVISAFMGYSNILSKQATAGIDKNNLEIFTILIAPFAPHFAEEIWERMGHQDSIFETGSWPVYDPSLIKETMIEIPIQINGKVRDTLEIEKGTDKEEIINRAKDLEKISDYLNGKNIIKEIYVPDKIVNFVISN